MNKKAQFYFLAAIIFAGVFISIITISNKVTHSNTLSYSWGGEEIDVEISYLLDYFSRLRVSDEDSKTVLINFSNSYVERFKPGKEAFFLFGKDGSFILSGYKKNETILILNTGSGDMNISETGVFQNEYSFSGEDDLTLGVDGVVYSIVFYPGQNFYYFLKYSSEGEEFIESGGTSTLPYVN